eukprot:NODE_2356_length_1222_cov_21.786871_g2150_i0.p1 GENE.NODE_2356_length_1222_cov_21.786871_g2150_i0~~NODE_2356_length_1222_cov_21.786871_g2150_i0.p1  ORF type:complete len:378 (+),score=94.56 NODE_2356_length_1222_cov_21.786871_g2150_i0:71-1135(+)
MLLIMLPLLLPLLLLLLGGVVMVLGEVSSPSCLTGVPHFLEITELSGSNIRHIIQLAKVVKRKTKTGELSTVFSNYEMALIFTKPSLRTRSSFEGGFHRLGGHTVYFAPSDIGLGKREAVKDIARVQSRFFDLIVARVHKHEHLKELACYSSVPVINALSDYNHPVQIMADLFTIVEHFKEPITNKKIVYVGDCNNIVTSWLKLASRVAFTLAVACPPTLSPPDAQALAEAKNAGLSTVDYFTNISAALPGADVIYADVWTSMGEKEKQSERLAHFKGWTITSSVMRSTGKPNTVFMHCLPAERGREVTEEVLESKSSIIFDQAENRQHVQMAILMHLLKPYGNRTHRRTTTKA